MFFKILLISCTLSLVNAEHSVADKEKLSVQVINIKRSVDFGCKIAKIEYEMKVYGLQNSQEGNFKDEEGKACVHAAADAAIAGQNVVLDETVGRAKPDLQKAVDTVMNPESASNTQWDSVAAFVKSFNTAQYRHETIDLFQNRLDQLLDELRHSMHSCLKQFETHQQVSDGNMFIDNTVAASGNGLGNGQGKPFVSGVISGPPSSQNKPQTRYGVAERERLSVEVMRALAGVEFGRRVGEIEAEARLAAARAEAVARGAAASCVGKVLAAAAAEESTLLDPTLGQALKTLRPLANAVAHPSAASDAAWDRVAAFLRSFRPETYRVTRQKAFFARLRPWMVRQQNAMKSCADSSLESNTV